MTFMTGQATFQQISEKLAQLLPQLKRDRFAADILTELQVKKDQFFASQILDEQIKEKLAGIDIEISIYHASLSEDAFEPSDEETVKDYEKRILEIKQSIIQFFQKS